MDNLEVAAAFFEIAELLDLKGEDPFKVRAYRRAGQAIELLQDDLHDLWVRNELRRIPGIGEALARKIAELLDTGRLEFLETLRAAVPPGLRELTRVPGLGGRTAAMLHARLGIASLEELELAARQHRLRDLPGFAVRKEANLLDALERLRRREATAPAAVLWPLALALQETLAGVPGMGPVAVAGALRRMAPLAPDVTLVAATADPAGAVAHLDRSPLVRDVQYHDGVAHCTTSLGRVARVWLVPPARFWAAVHGATGSADHLAELAALGPLPAEPAAEADIYTAVGLPFIAPELRESPGAVAAAQAGALPELVRQDAIRGDLHSHTRWSDGTATAAEMAGAARALGYEYLAITDHSQSLKVANGLTPGRVTAQAREIDGLNRGFSDFRLLKGTEVDILKDGSLDLPDALLAELDVVVASVHSHMRLDEAAMTARLEAAVKNPHVDIIGHPTGRRLGYRDAYPLRLERVLELAARTGTALEINASPARLDLDGELVRLARACGVKLAVGTDAHSPEELRGLGWGLGQARRGWLEAGDLVNAQPLPALLRWLRRDKG